MLHAHCSVTEPFLPVRIVYCKCLQCGILLVQFAHSRALLGPVLTAGRGGSSFHLIR